MKHLIFVTLLVMSMFLQSCDDPKAAVKKFTCDNAQTVTDVLSDKIATAHGCTHPELMQLDFLVYTRDDFLKCNQEASMASQLCESLAGGLLEAGYEKLFSLEKIKRYGCSKEVSRQTVMPVIKLACSIVKEQEA